MQLRMLPESGGYRGALKSTRRHCARPAGGMTGPVTALARNVREAVSAIPA